MQLVELPRVGLFADDGLLVVRLEGVLDIISIVDEIEDECVFLSGTSAVETRERLHGLNAVESLVHVHRVQKRLIEAGLVFLGDKQQLVLFGCELVRQLLLPDRSAGLVAVHIRLGVAHARSIRVYDGAGECDERLDFGVALFLDLPVEFLLVADGVQPGAGDDHRLGPAADLVAGEGVEVLQHDFRLLGDVVGVQAHEAGERLGCLALAHLRVVRDGLDEPVVGLVGRVVLEHVEDEAFLDGLPHAVEVERPRLAVRARGAEDFERLVFRGGGEGEEADVRLFAASGHCAWRISSSWSGSPWAWASSFAFFLMLVGGEDALQFRCRLAGLGTVGLVDDDGVVGGLAGRPPCRCTKGNFCSVVMMIGVPVLSASASWLGVLVDLLDDALLVVELVDGVLELPVEHEPVGDDDDGIEDLARPWHRAGWPGGGPARQSSCSCRCRRSAGSGSSSPRPLLRASASRLRTATSW